MTFKIHTIMQIATTTTTTTDKKYVAYYRVSTQKQGASGLGLESQKHLVSKMAPVLISEYTEVESGAKNDRPVLLAAIADAKRHGATLIIAYLSRLSRNAAFTLALMDSGVDFVCCDMPQANKLTIGIMAVINEDARRTISTNTKNGLAAKKARGEKMGTPANLTDEARQKSLDKRRKKTEAKFAVTKEFAQLLRNQGDSFQKIADKLNVMGFETARGKSTAEAAYKFTACSVQRMLKK